MEPPIPPGAPFTLEVWTANERIEARLAVIYPILVAFAAFEAAVAADPKRRLTLRQGARLVRRWPDP